MIGNHIIRNKENKMAKEIYMYVLGAILVLGFIVLLAILIFVPIPQGNGELLYLAVGSFITFVGAVVGYFYGSSKGSADKTQLMAKDKQG